MIVKFFAHLINKLIIDRHIISLKWMCEIINIYGLENFKIYGSIHIQTHLRVDDR